MKLTRLWHLSTLEQPNSTGWYWVSLEKLPGSVYLFCLFRVGLRWMWYDANNRDDHGIEYPQWTYMAHQRALCKEFGMPRYWSKLEDGEMPEVPFIDQDIYDYLKENSYA